MTQQEFFDRTKIDLTSEQYAIVERIYMATGHKMDKDAFCKSFVRMYKSGGIEIATSLANYVEVQHEYIKKADATILQQIREMRETAEFLIGKAHAYNDTDFHNVAVSLIGCKDVALITLELGLPLFDEDKMYIKDNLQ